MDHKRYRLYIDEAGDHVYSQDENNAATRYLGITGVLFENELYKNFVHPNFLAFKERHFPHHPDEPVIFHRKELINKSGPFRPILDSNREMIFNDDLLQTLNAYDFKLFTIVIDKNAHLTKYKDSAVHPYHYAVHILLERYADFLKDSRALGDVMIESRGGREDMQLKEAYKTKSVSFPQILTTNEIKIQQKTANITGLQIADLLAYPCRMEVLYSENRVDSMGGAYGQNLCRTVEDKYVEGGKVFLG
jgi:hypothetical protein